MNDKELFRYLQEIKVILNDLKYNDYENELNFFKEEYNDFEINYSDLLIKYTKLKIKLKILYVLSFGTLFLMKKSNIILFNDLDKEINEMSKKSKNLSVKIIDLVNKFNKNNNLIQSYDKNFEQINLYLEMKKYEKK